MPLTNPGTQMDEDGWADVISDIRKLYLMMAGGGNDLNNSTDTISQVSDQFVEVDVHVCENGIEKSMKVLGTKPSA